MKKLLLILLFPVLLFSQTYVLQDSVSGTVVGSYAIGINTSYRQTGTRVAVHGDYTVTRIGLYAYKVLTPTNRFLLEIRGNDAINRDPAAVIGTSPDSIETSSFATGTYAWKYIDIPAGIDISAHDTVWVCTQYTTAKLDATNYINWARKTAANKEGFTYGSAVWLNNNTLATLVRLYSTYTAPTPAATTTKRDFGGWPGSFKGFKK